VRLSTSSMDSEEAFHGDKLESLIERHDDGAKVAGSNPSLSSPPEDLNRVGLAGRPQARDRSSGPPAIRCITAVGAHDPDAAAREGVGGDAVVQFVGPDCPRDLLRRPGLPCRVQQAGRRLGSWHPRFPGPWPTGCGRSPVVLRRVHIQRSNQGNGPQAPL
jgi:hypothetical protein